MRSTILLLLTVCLTSVLFLFPSARAAVPGARVQNDSSYILYGTYHVVGEVLNTGDVPLRFIAVTVTFKDQNGRVVDVVRGYVYGGWDEFKCMYLPPGQKAPFDILELDSAKSARISSYTLTLEFQEAATPFQNPLTVESVSNSTDSEGELLVSGEVKNNGIETSKFTTVVGTFYDTNGGVVYVAFALTIPNDIPAGQSYAFQLTVPDAQISSRVRKYALLAAAPLPLDHLVINEVEIGLQGGTLEEQSSSVELYNPTSASVDLSGWTIRAERSQVTITLPQGTMIEPKGYQATFLGATVCSGCSERLTLRDSHGDEIDTTPWLDHIAMSGFSWQRYPDGSDNWRSSPSTFHVMNIPELPSPAASAAVILLACGLVLRAKIRPRGNCRH